MKVLKNLFYVVNYLLLFACVWCVSTALTFHDAHVEVRWQLWSWFSPSSVGLRDWTDVIRLVCQALSPHEPSHQLCLSAGSQAWLNGLNDNFVLKKNQLICLFLQAKSKSIFQLENMTTVTFVVFKNQLQWLPSGHLDYKLLDSWVFFFFLFLFYFCRKAKL